LDQKPGITRYNIEHRKPTVKEYQNLRGTTDWFSIEDEVVERSLANDLFSVCVLTNSQLVGMGRIVGDGAIYFYIQDIIVAPDYKGKGVGRYIMNEIESFLKENASNNSFIGLMAAEGVQEFYRKFGYIERPGTKPGMYKMMKK
jgi:ribosomal protein S18 acetylase RimI-like enzyme